MPGKTCLVMSLFLVLGLVLWAAKAEPATQRVHGVSDAASCLPLPGGGASASGGLMSLASGLELLMVDTNIGYGYRETWREGHQLGAVLRASSHQYPLTVRSIECYISRFPGSMSMVRLQGHVYAMVGGVPGGLLGSSDPVEVGLGGGSWDAKWVSLDVSDADVRLAEPAPFLVVVEYADGKQGQTPSIISDVSTDIAQGACYYRMTPGSWTEHYDFWGDASEVGYSMVRAIVDTSGGPSDRVMLEALADAALASGQPTLGQGELPYLQVGARDPVIGNLRSVIRYPLPEAPVEGADVLSADVRLYHYHEVTTTVPLTLTAYRVTDPWDEASATWLTNSATYGEAYGTAEIPARDPSLGSRDRLVYVDVTGLLQGWLQETFANYGLVLIGGEDSLDSCKWFRSREHEDVDERPKLIVKWALTSPTVSPPPTPDSGQLFWPLVMRR